MMDTMALLFGIPQREATQENARVYEEVMETLDRKAAEHQALRALRNISDLMRQKNQGKGEPNART